MKKNLMVIFVCAALLFSAADVFAVSTSRTFLGDNISLPKNFENETSIRGFLYFQKTLACW